MALVEASRIRVIDWMPKSNDKGPKGIFKIRPEPSYRNLLENPFRKSPEVRGQVLR